MTLLLALLYLISGAAGLIYEILWLRWLSLLFGNTAHASATVLSVFFLGISAGSAYWGRRSRDLDRPLRAYALLETAIAASALVFLLLTGLLRTVYTGLYGATGQHLLLLIPVRFFMAVLVLFLPAFFMGGTFPVLAQHLVGGMPRLGRTGSLLYGANTIGAALGAFAAGFYLLPAFGLRASCGVAIALNLVIAILVLLVERRAAVPAVAASEETGIPAPPDGGAPEPAARPSLPGGSAPVPKGALPPRVITLLSFASGFAVLSLEVLWTRMFSQVLHNSVYSFAAILVVFLVALALGSMASNLLCRLDLAPPAVLTALVLASGILVALTPRAFAFLTRGLEDVVSSGGFEAYMTRVFGLAAMVMLVPAVIMGTVFPYLFRVSQSAGTGPGRTVGALAATNAVGGILGSLVAGFLLLETAGLWRSILLMAALYFTLVVPIAAPFRAARILPRAAAAGALIAILFVARLGDLPPVHVDREAGEKVLESWEGSMGTVAVVRAGDDLRIKVNNYYRLGGVQGFSSEQRQAQIPLFLAPDPRSVFFLGVGTGISAGAALDFPVQRVVACELVPEVVTASRQHFGDYTNGLYTDPRVRIVVEDGRTFLLSTREHFDLVVSDLFVPWHAGTGSLYTLEHFRLARARLSDRGIFVQWVPLCQLSREDFGVLARTVLEVFPHATFWRGEFVPGYPTGCIVCPVEDQPLDPDTVARNTLHVLKPPVPGHITEANVIPYLLYAGNLGGCRELFARFPVNTDDHPRIEYGSPRTQLRERAGETTFLTSFALIDLVRELFARLPPERDPYLRRLSPDELGYVRAGQELYEAGVYLDAGRPDEARPIYRDFLRRVPFHIFPALEN